MTRTPRALTMLLAATLGGAVLGGALQAPATAAAAPVELRLGDLPKGPPPTVPYVVDRVLHDGAVSVTLPRGITRFMGKAGDDYVVQGYDQKAQLERVVRVTAQGARTTLAEGVSLSDATLAADGASFVASRSLSTERTVLRRYDAVTGAVTLKHTVDGYARVLDYDGATAVIGGFGPVWTSAWDVTTDSVRRLVKRAGYRADIAADRLAVFTKDPYRGGCTDVSALLSPRKSLWRSCDEAVVAFAPDGSRLATVHILSDGLGPNRFTLRKTAGRKLAVYDAPYYFGEIWFEDGRDVLAQTYAKTKGALLRCDGDGCERATAITPHEAPLLAVR